VCARARVRERERERERERRSTKDRHRRISMRERERERERDREGGGEGGVEEVPRIAIIGESVMHSSSERSSSCNRCKEKHQGHISSSAECVYAQGVFFIQMFTTRLM
jgi:hypothetical protein